MKFHLAAVILTIMSAFYTAHSTSWSTVSCSNPSLEKQCYHSIADTANDIEFSVSHESRRIFSIEFEGICPQFDEALSKVKHCETCKTTFNVNDNNRSDCIDN